MPHREVIVEHLTIELELLGDRLDGLGGLSDERDVLAFLDAAVVHETLLLGADIPLNDLARCRDDLNNELKVLGRVSGKLSAL
jgi:hypothetical protein